MSEEVLVKNRSVLNKSLIIKGPQIWPIKHPPLYAILLIIDEKGRIISVVGRNGTIKDKDSNSVPQDNHWVLYAASEKDVSSIKPAYLLAGDKWELKGEASYPKPNPVGKDEYTILLWVTEEGALYLASGPEGKLDVFNQNPLNPGDPVDDHYFIYAVETEKAPPGCYLYNGRWYC